MIYHQPLQIIGFHSCDRTIGLRILNGEDDLIASDNTWDWLGPGVYFWEQNPARALEYALDSSSGRQKNKIPIKTPFVIGAIIELGNCLNLLEPSSLNVLKNAYGSLHKAELKSGSAMPQNKNANRQLDCAVIKYVHEINRRVRLPAYDTIRSAFSEGQHIYPGSTFTDRLHVEICVCNKEAIKGYFLPRPIEDFNPYLQADRTSKKE